MDFGGRPSSNYFVIVCIICEIRVHVVALVCFVVLFLKPLAKGRGTMVSRHLLMDVSRIDGLETGVLRFEGGKDDWS